MKYLVTGASGFVGKILCTELTNMGHLVCASSHVPNTLFPEFVFFDFSGTQSQVNAADAFNSVDCIIHCAAKAHILKENDSDIVDSYRTVNIESAIKIARYAIKFGVKRLIFLSTIGVYGKPLKTSHRLDSNDPVSPLGWYAISKYEAEMSLQKIAAQSGLELVIIRSPLIYGPGVKGNFLRLMRLINTGLPLPFRCFSNKRSFVSIDNFIDLIICCARHPKAANQIFLVSDNRDLSLPELIGFLSNFMDKPTKLFAVPIPMIRVITKILKKEEDFNKLNNALLVNIDNTCKILGWTPKNNLEIGLRKMAESFLETQ